jgi:hypothetical protein
MTIPRTNAGIFFMRSEAASWQAMVTPDSAPYATPSARVAIGGPPAWKGLRFKAALAVKGERHPLT